MAETWLHLPTQTLFGEGALTRVGIIASQYGTRALLVTESILPEWEFVEKAKKYLSESGVKTIVYSEIGDNSTSMDVEKVVSMAEKSKTEIIIGLGGVQTLSIAKSAARLSTTGHSVDSVLSGAQFPQGGLPYIEIPTTCRSPFLFTDRCLLVDARNRNSRIVSSGQYTDHAVIDPQLSLSLSAKFTATTLLDTLLFAVEGFISRKSSFLTDKLLLDVCKPLLFLMKPAVLEPNNMEYRVKASQYGLFTSIGLASSSYGLGSAIALVLGGKFSLPHSWIASIILPYILEWANRAVPDHLYRIVESVDEDKLGSPLHSNTELIDFTRYTIASLKLPMRLHTLDLELSKITACIPQIRDIEGTSFLPVTVTENDIYEILQQAY